MVMYISHFKYDILSAEEHQVNSKEMIILYLFNPISNSKLKFTIVSHSLLNIWQQWYTLEYQLSRIWKFDLLLEGDILDLPSWIYVVLSR